MKKEDISYWKDTIKNCEKYYSPKHKRWSKLIDIYNLNISVPNLSKEFVIKISRFFPLVRKLIASISFNYPRVFMTVEDEPFEFASEVLERFANESLDVMNAKREVQQCIFDALFCYRGFMKVGYNNADTEEAQAPYIFNDALQEDFTYVKRVNPYNIFVDPLTPPNDFSAAQFVIEKMLVPLEFAKADERFSSAKRQFVPVDDKGSGSMIDDMFTDYQNGQQETNEEDDAIKEMKRLQKMVLLYEIHDRIHKKRIVFANDIEQPVEDIEHPFLARDPITTTDQFTGEELLTGEFGTPKGWLTTNGCPYYSMQFDMSDSFYGLPMMEYVKDLQQLIVESVSRRVDLLKKHHRITLGSRAEKISNPNLPDNLQELKDGSVLYVDDTVSSFRELNWGTVPADQYNIERDILGYESQILAVVPQTSRTATGAAIEASESQLNREWMQVGVSGCYEWIIQNCFSIMSDQRYTPNQFFLNISPDGEQTQMAALENFWLQGRRRIDIDTGSMMPLIEQLERDDTLGLVDRLLQMPEVDRTEVVKMMIKAFRQHDPEKLLRDDVDADAQKAAQLELMGWIFRGQDPGVSSGENHAVHLQIQSPEAIQQNPMYAQVLQQGGEQASQAAMAAAQTHVQAHQQAMQQQAGQLGKPRIPAQTIPQDIIGQVQSNAQRTAAAVKAST